MWVKNLWWCNTLYPLHNERMENNNDIGHTKTGNEYGSNVQK